jgi:hypothetical protein
MNGPEAAQTGEEAEDQVLGDEAPREQTDDRSDLATDDRAHADAACAPEGCAGDCAEKKECDLFPPVWVLQFPLAPMQLPWGLV